MQIGLRLVHNLLTVRPAFENIPSDGVDVDKASVEPVWVSAWHCPTTEAVWFDKKHPFQQNTVQTLLQQ